MHLEIFPNKESLGMAAAKKAADILTKTIQKKGKANFIAATGASQF